MTSTKRTTKASKARKGTTSTAKIRAALRLAINAAWWSGVSEAINASGKDPNAPITNERGSVSMQHERKAWEYLATIPGDVGSAARRELDARSNRGKTLH